MLKQRSDGHLEPPFELSRDTRRWTRIVPNLSAVRFATNSGNTFPGRIINLSPFGVAVECDMTLAKEETVVKVGTKDVLSGRVIARGMVFLFKRPVALSRFDRNIVL